MHGVFHSEASEVVLPMCINSPAVVGKKYAVSIDDKHEIRSGWEVSNALGLADPQDSAREKKKHSAWPFFACSRGSNDIPARKVRRPAWSIKLVDAGCGNARPLIN